MYNYSNKLSLTDHIIAKYKLGSIMAKQGKYHLYFFFSSIISFMVENIIYLSKNIVIKEIDRERRSYFPKANIYKFIFQKLVFRSKKNVYSRNRFPEVKISVLQINFRKVKKSGENNRRRTR